MENKVIDLNININVTGPSDQHIKPGVPETDHRPMLKTGLSVAQLAYFFRMLVDNEVIKTNNTTDLIRCVIKNISTAKTDEISFDSFKTKYYNPDISAKQAIQGVVIKQLNYLRNEL